MIKVLSRGSNSKVLVWDVQIRSDMQELSNGRPLPWAIWHSSLVDCGSTCGQKGWWQEPASYARLYVFSWIWGFGNFPMCSVSLYTDWACLLPRTMFLRLGLERFTNLTQRKTNVGKQQTTDNAWYTCDGNRNTSLLCSGFPNYWLLISWRIRIACNWSHPSSILLLTRVMQDAWWPAERKGKRKREELRSHARANCSGRITHDFKNISYAWWT